MARPARPPQARLFELLLGLLGRLGERAPVVLVVEDLHWADQSTRDLLAFLVRNLRAGGCCWWSPTATTSRASSGWGPTWPSWTAAAEPSVWSSPGWTGPRRPPQLTGILGAAPAADLVDGVFARSEGNPFFTEELLARMRAGRIELPPALRDLLRGRVEALPEPAQQVLEVAAVAGRQVPIGCWPPWSAWTTEQLVGRCGRRSPASCWWPTRRDGYDFRHALLREVVDADLLPGERARLHAAYARALDRAAGAGRPGRRRDRCRAAPSTGMRPVTRPGRCRPGSRPAGRGAALGARRGPRHYQRALELWDQVPDAAARGRLDRVTCCTGRRSAAFTGHNERAMRAGARRSTGRPGRRAARAGALLVRLGRYRWTPATGGALATFEQAEPIPAEPPPSADGSGAGRPRPTPAAGSPPFDAQARCRRRSPSPGRSGPGPWRATR